MDDEALDLLLDAQRAVSCRRCSSSWPASSTARSSACRRAVIDGHKETLEGGAESARMILKAGGRLGMGGDYGFAWNPHGDYAKELTFFVKYVGFTPLETITCATKTGAEIMGRGHEFGTLEAGKLADVLVVDGDVLADIAVLEDRSRFIAVMQGGVVKAGRLAEDVDAALGGTQDEPAGEVIGDRPGADQEPAPQSHLKRRSGTPRLERTHPFPWALGATLDRLVETTTAGHLERLEPGGVEDLGHVQYRRGRDRACQGLLRQQPNGGVYQPGHAREMYRASRVSTLIRSPCSTNSGTCTIAPVSSVAGLVTLETVSPLTPGLVATTSSSTDAGSCTAVGLPSTKSSCTVSFSRMNRSSSVSVSSGR